MVLLAGPLRSHLLGQERNPISACVPCQTSPLVSRDAGGMEGQREAQVRTITHPIVLSRRCTAALQGWRAGMLLEQVRPGNVAAPGQGVLGSPRGLGLDLIAETPNAGSKLAVSYGRATA